MAKRVYSDEERAACLAALASNGGNVKKTARQCGVPRPTLIRWVQEQEGVSDVVSNQPDTDRTPKKTTPERVAEIVPEAKATLSSLFKNFASRCLSLTTDDDIKGAKLKDRITSAAIAVDKSQLLDGKATSIAGHDLSGLTDDELDRELEEVEREETAFEARVALPPGPEQPS